MTSTLEFVVAAGFYEQGDQSELNLKNVLNERLAEHLKRERTKMV